MRRGFLMKRLPERTETRVKVAPAPHLSYIWVLFAAGFIGTIVVSLVWVLASNL